jgi:glucose-1-phosphate thymidylyltransferase
MKVIIPAAGLGSRLRPHTFTTPKSLLTVAGKPILAYILDQVVACGAGRVTLIVGHLREQIEKWVTENYDLDVDFREQAQKLGLGHAVLIGLDPDDREVLVILGDTIIDTDLKQVIARGISSIGVKEVADPRKLGVVVVENGRVTKLVEKPADPPSQLAIVGVYYFNDGKLLGRAIKEVIEQGITVKGEYQITDALQLMVNWGELLEVFPVDGWFDCGRPETLIATNRYLFNRDGGSRGTDLSLQNATIIDPVALGDRVRIEDSVVGPYVSLGAGSCVRRSVIRDSLIGRECQITQLLLDQSLLGNRVVVNGTFQTLNLGASSGFGTAG